MRTWLLIASLVVVGCDGSGNTNIVDDANDARLQEYEQALAEADRMAEQDTEVEE